MSATPLPPIGMPRESADSLRIAGLTRLSTVDLPGALVATVFLQGCPWECVYCHNPDLIDPRSRGDIAWSEVLSFLRTRVGLLDGVVFSGGEPTMQRALGAAIDDVRRLGFRVGLHTGGPYPALLARILPRVDWVGIDAKARVDGYARVTGRPSSGRAAERSLDLVLANHLVRRGTARPLDYEVRTTVHPDLIDDRELGALGRDLADRGAEVWAVQRYRRTGARSGVPVRAELRLDDLPRDRFTELVVR